MHVIKLNGYNATTENGEKLELGTFDSYGEEELQIVEAPDWVNLSVIATFNPPNKKPVRVAVDSVTGVIKVPKEATADLYGVGTIVFVGIADGVQRISADCEYIVRKHSNASGTEPAEPTPDLLQQVLTLSKDAQTAAKNAEQSAKNAEQSAESAAKDAADTVKPYKEEAVQAATAAALSEKNAAESKATAQEAAERATQAGIAASNAAEEAERSAGIATDAAGGSALNAENAHKSALNAQQSANNAAESQSEAKANADAAASAKKAQDVADSLPADYVTAVNDIATLKQQVANITPDDSAIGGKPWSSKHIIDMLCPPLEESGNPVVCYPVAGYALGVKAMWEPAQEGTGTPSPENIRPIKGRDSVTVDRCGENVIEFLSTEDSSSDIKIAVDAEKNITLNGTLAGKGNITIGTCRLHWVAGKTYTMYVKKVGGSVSLGSGDGITFAYALFTTDYNHFFRGGTNSTNLDVYIASDAALVETELVFMLQCWRKGTVFNNFKFQIEVVEGTTTPSTYTPYNGQTNTLTLPETAYGGEVDAVTGDGNNNTKVITLDGNELKFRQSSIYFNLPMHSAPGILARGIICCSHFDSKRFGVNTNYEFCFILASDIADLFANVDDLNAYLAAQYAAGTPVQVCYKLAEPTSFTATGAQPIPALAGVNTVLTDADSATVTGRADPIKRIEDLEDAVASQT